MSITKNSVGLNTTFEPKKCAPKLVFFNEKKIEKDWDDF